MVSKLDDSVGALIEALQEKQMLDNSIVVFISDNGAPTLGAYRNWGSNYPLRGTKHTLFEGGVRGVALVWSSLIHQRPRVSNELMHITDWLPTLYSAAGGDITGLDPEIDGIDQWPTFAYDLPSARNDVLLNIDESTRNAALRFYNWKLIVGRFFLLHSLLYVLSCFSFHITLIYMLRQARPITKYVNNNQHQTDT